MEGDGILFLANVLGSKKTAIFKVDDSAKINTANYCP